MAEREYYTNKATTTLNGAINNSVTSITLTDATAFPAKQFRLLIDSEIMYCSSRSGNTLTVVRGSEGTTAASHSDLSAVKHILTAGSLEQVKLDIMAMNGIGRKPVSANTYGDEFDDDNFSGWTTVLGSGVTLTTTEKDHFLAMDITTGTTGQLTAFMKDTGGSLSAGNWIEFAINIYYMRSGFPRPVLLMTDGVTYGSGNQVSFGFTPNENLCVLRTSTNYVLTSGSQALVDMPKQLNCPNLILRLEYNGSNTYNCYQSFDGISYIKTVNNVAAGGSMVPRYVGFGMTTWDSLFHAAMGVRYVRTNF